MYDQAGMWSIGIQYFQPSMPRVEDPLYKWVLGGGREHQSSPPCLFGVQLLQQGAVEDEICQPDPPDLKLQPQTGSGRPS